MTRPLIVLVDVDGVCVDFVSPSFEAHGKDYAEDGPLTQWSIAEHLGITPEEYWKGIDDMGSEFWSDLPDYPWTTPLISSLRKQAGDQNVFFCTAPSRSPECAHGKKVWLNKTRYPQQYVMTPHKHLLAKPNVLLIDDSERNIDNFALHGGRVWLWPQPWNRKGRRVLTKDHWQWELSDLLAYISRAQQELNRTSA